MAYWCLFVLFVLQSVLVTSRVSGDMTTSGKKCVFPFTYKGAVYTNCTTKDWHRPWCSTTANYSWPGWEHCKVSGQMTISPGKNCVFPFTYKGVVYRSCSTYTAEFFTSHHRPWCSTTATYSSSRWEYCEVEEDYSAKPYTSRPKTISAKNCVFPFTYKGAVYRNCTTKDHHSPWCSTTANYGSSRWEYCKVSGKTISGKNCVFPFIYKGVKYISCTTNSYHNRPWCSTTANYDKDGKWGNCVDFIPSGQWTWGFKSCVFPFTYKGVVYDSCTSKDHNRPWCSTTAIYEGKWGNCLF